MAQTTENTAQRRFNSFAITAIVDTQGKYNKIKTDSRNLECHDETWREWSSSVRQDIFMEILSKEDIFVYQEHGYNLDFIY